MKTSNKKPRRQYTHNVHVINRMRASGYVSAKELSSILGIHVGSIYRWVSKGDVGVLRVGGRTFVSKKDVIANLGPEASAILGIVGKNTLTKPVAVPKRSAETILDIDLEMDE